tara:strand:+ start:10547 stop:12220 length:1674 start_codon:yes stop_codon:yes gene_type:complete
MLISCATPVAPTGGEPDRTGPKVVSTEPSQGSTNFSGNEVRFNFDKYVDRNNFRNNVTIEPDLGIEFDISFSRKSATVEFASDLPENTTIIVKLGTDVTDTNRNKMERPVDLALSTGDVLDSATISAKTINAETGAGQSGWRVFLYREPYNINERAVYISETDTSGIVEFGYIGEGNYKAFWVNDQNRDRIWNQGREQAQPFYNEMFFINEGDSIDIGTLFVSMPDTISPRIEGVGLLSERRLRLRLSEEIIWDPESYLSVTDTLGNEYTRAYPLYLADGDDNILFAQTEQELVESEMFTLEPYFLSDPAGNNLRVDFSPFIGSNEPDTTILRTISHNSGIGLFPDEPLEVTYSRFIDDPSVLDSLQVVEGDRVIENWENIEVDKHILRISPLGTWQSGIRYQFRVWNPWEMGRELIDPDIWQRNQLGSIEVTLTNNNPESLSHLTLTDENLSIRMDTTFTNTVILDNLPPLNYKIIVFQDEDGNGRWEPGVVEPYQQPEPYAIRRRVPVREGFTSELEIDYPVIGGSEPAPQPTENPAEDPDPMENDDNREEENDQ